jgi:hypothetical protein
MTPELWNIAIAAIQSLDDAPPWLRNQAWLSFEAAANLPVLDFTVDGDDARPNIEEKVLKADYLDFLREQIELETRGPEWNKILKTRLAALSPFIDKKIITAMFHKKPGIVMLQVDPDTKKVIRFEIH